MPGPVVAGALGTLLGRVITVYLVGKAGQFVLNLFAFFGLAWASNSFVIQPALDQILGFFAQIPPELKNWLGFFRFDVCAAMLLSAYTISAAKVFLVKR